MACLRSALLENPSYHLHVGFDALLWDQFFEDFKGARHRVKITSALNCLVISCKNEIFNPRLWRQ